MHRGKISPFWTGMVAAIALIAGCGQSPVLPISRGLIEPDSIEMGRVESLNKSGVLTSLDLNLLEDHSFKVLAAPVGSAVTKLGVIRSRMDGQFFLQVRRGLFDKYLGYPEWNIPLKGSDENKTREFGGYLNQLVILRGVMLEQDILEVRLILQAPSLSFVTDLVEKGRITGTVYDQSTKLVIRDATMTLRSSSNGNLFCATSKYDGRYAFFSLPAGRYSLLVEKAGFQPYRLGEIKVVDHCNSQTFVHLIAGASNPTPIPVPSLVPNPTPSPSNIPIPLPSSPSVVPSVSPTKAPSPAPSCLANPLIWVNTETGIYHYPSSIWYGATRKGAFMPESEAKAKGYRPSRIS